MEMLSEHTVEGWLEGYILSGRHGLIKQIACQQYAYQFGIDRPEEADWKWSY